MKLKVILKDLSSCMNTNDKFRYYKLNNDVLQICKSCFNNKMSIRFPCFWYRSENVFLSNNTIYIGAILAVISFVISAVQNRWKSLQKSKFFLFIWESDL